MSRLKGWSRLLFVGLGVALLGAIVFGAYSLFEPKPAFSRERAIEYAKKLAPSTLPEVGMKEARIDQVTAELMSLSDAHKRVGVDSTRYDNPRVWLVMVDGKFVYEGYPKPEAHEIFQSDSQFFILNATTGVGDVSGFSTSRLVALTPRAPAPTPTP